MDPLVSTLVLILLALLGARFSFSTRQVPAGPQLMLRTGIHFLGLGFLLGPVALGLLSLDAQEQLSPLLVLALGWIGLLFGLQLDRSAVGQFPRKFLVVAFSQAALTFILCLVAAWWAAGVLGLQGATTTLLVLGAAATACVSAPAAVAMVSGNFKAKGKVRELLYFMASLDAVVGLLALEVGYAALHGTPALAGEGPTQTWFWLLMAVALSVVCAVLFLWLSRLRPSREERVLYLLGLSALVSGAALQLRLSPLFVGMLSGALVSNLNPRWHQLFQTMAGWEKPIYLLLLLLAGAALRFETFWVVPLALGYAVVRGLAKVTSNAVLVNVVSLPFPTPNRLGLGLIPQGGISIAMALSLAVMIRASSTPSVLGVDAGDLLFGTVVLGVLLSELVAPLCTVSVLRAAGEMPENAGVPPGPRHRGSGPGESR